MLSALVPLIIAPIAYRAISPKYTVVDYVPEFVERARENFPEANIVVGDAWDMSEFENERFSYVLFSYNGLGCIFHDDRLLEFFEKPINLNWLFKYN